MTCFFAPEIREYDLAERELEFGGRRGKYCFSGKRENGKYFGDGINYLCYVCTCESRGFFF